MLSFKPLLVKVAKDTGADEIINSITPEEFDTLSNTIAGSIDELIMRHWDRLDKNGRSMTASKFAFAKCVLTAHIIESSEVTLRQFSEGKLREYDQESAASLSQALSPSSTQSSLN